MAGAGNGKENGRNPRRPSEVGARVRRRRRERTRQTRGVRRAILLVLALGFAGAIVAVAATAITGVQAFKDSCTTNSLEEVSIGTNSFVFDANGRFLAAIPADNNRQPIDYEDITPDLLEATVAIEDRRFWEHNGIDYESVARAALANFQAQDVVQGGSTITQQLVRNLYQPVGNEQTLTRKLKEACLALELERIWEKERILEGYVNQVYYGNRAYGVEAAAQTYFAKSARKLSLAESALLAGLPQLPSYYDPFTRREAALARRNAVLAAMLELGSITRPEYRDAVETPIELSQGRLYSRIREPLFFNFVREQLIQEYGASVVRKGGLKIYTTIDPAVQDMAEDAIKSTLNEEGDPASAIAAIDPKTGAIRAMVSVSPGDGRTQFNLAAQGRRQSGSSFKTFVLVEAVRRGIDPSSTSYVSAPFTLEIEGAEPWHVSTFDGSYAGAISLASATLRSDNSVYARLTMDLGPASVAKIAAEMGVRSPLQPVASIGLGSNDVSVLDMASAYATLAAGGVYHEPMAIRRVEIGGEIDDDAGWGQPERKRVLPDGVAYEVTRILEQNVLGGTGTGAIIPGRPAAGKTGTTDDFTDAWFVGYTPTLAAAVWVGYPDSRVSMTNVHGRAVSGGSFPATIWQRFVSAALAGTPSPDWPLPRNPAEWRDWDGDNQFSGQAPSTTETTATVTEPLPGGTEPIAPELPPVTEPDPGDGEPLPPPEEPIPPIDPAPPTQTAPPPPPPP
jgi:penicillin-binding protein 1A